MSRAGILFCHGPVLFLFSSIACLWRDVAWKTAKRQGGWVVGRNWDFREGPAPGASLRETQEGNPVCAV